MMRGARLAVVSGVIALIGILLLLWSPVMGVNAGHAWLAAQGGSSDTAKFMAVMSGYIDSFRLLGGVLAALGLVGVFQQVRDANQ